MSEERKRKLTVIDNTNIESELHRREKERDKAAPPNIGYQTNPMYEKLLNFKEKQKKKRFSIEDLLKW